MAVDISGGVCAQKVGSLGCLSGTAWWECSGRRRGGARERAGRRGWERCEQDVAADCWTRRWRGWSWAPMHARGRLIRRRACGVPSCARPIWCDTGRDASRCHLSGARRSIPMEYPLPSVEGRSAEQRCAAARPCPAAVGLHWRGRWAGIVHQTRSRAPSFSVSSHSLLEWSAASRLPSPFAMAASVVVLCQEHTTVPGTTLRHEKQETAKTAAAHLGRASVV